MENSEEQQMETNIAEETGETVTPAHPFQDELSQFKPHMWQLEEKEPQMYSSLGDTKFTMVDSQPLLNGMMSKLKAVTELAIGIEYHSYRSFHRMIGLVQISTRTEDFFIDPLILKEELKVLNEVCTDSNILKVMYGSDRDIEWLQKDFGIYVINMFDTKKAASALRLKNNLLEKILKKYCKIDIKNNEYQKADWRVRPLPDGMVKCAREEVHFLLYIHDVFRNSLLKKKTLKKALENVYKACTVICGSLWHPDKYAFRPDTYMACYNRTKVNKLNVQQLECFRLLCEWRHNISKVNDESRGYTLPNKMMFDISKALPSEVQGIVKCCNPVPPLVEENLEVLLEVVFQAIENVPVVPEVVPEVPKEPTKKGTDKSLKSKSHLLGIKNSKNKKMNQVKRSTTTTITTITNNNKKKCLLCGHLGHLVKDCVNRNNTEGFGGIRPPLSGGAAWNGGHRAPFRAYPPSGPGMRGGPGFQGRGAHPIDPMRMHPYRHLPPHHPLRYGMYHDNPLT